MPSSTNTPTPQRQAFPLGQSYTPLTSIPTLGQALTVGDPTGIDYVNSFLHVLAQNSDVAQQEYLEGKRKKKRKQKWSYDYPEIKKTNSREKEKRFKKRRASEPVLSGRSVSLSSASGASDPSLSVGDIYLDQPTSIVEYGQANSSKNQQHRQVVVSCDSGICEGEESSSSPDSASFGEEEALSPTPSLVAVAPRFQQQPLFYSDKTTGGMMEGGSPLSLEEQFSVANRASYGVHRYRHSAPSFDSHYLSTSSGPFCSDEFPTDHNSSPDTSVLETSLHSDALYADQFFSQDNDTPQVVGFLEQGIDGHEVECNINTDHNENLKNLEEQVHLDQNHLHDGASLQQEFNILLEDLSCEQWWEEISCL